MKTRNTTFSVDKRRFGKRRNRQHHIAETHVILKGLKVTTICEELSSALLNTGSRIELCLLFSRITALSLHEHLACIQPPCLKYIGCAPLAASVR
jgi:hypothetical protein